ncbi:RtcB family protein [Spirochaetota bacterium]
MKANHFKKINNYLYEIPRDFKPGMRVPARIYATEKILMDLDDNVIDQLTNVTMLPGIIKHSICMPDAHSGYGFPIGGVAAIDPHDGVISPGGIGFDINCGVRLLVTSLTYDDVKPKLKELVDSLYNRVPSGVGSTGMLKLSLNQLDGPMQNGARWAVKNGYGETDDLDNIEEGGCISQSNPHSISKHARERGKNQIGTLGSGNHYLEIQVAREENIYDMETAKQFGITKKNQILIMIHTGSRGFGHQVATDYLKKFQNVMQNKYKLSMPDRELACAPFHSKEGQDYFNAMNCAINFAFANRQLITHRVREVFSDIFSQQYNNLNIKLIYDVCHNTAKLEKHNIDGKETEILIHRKGATRAFPKGMQGIPVKYKNTGQPVIIGGNMEVGSYILAGIENSKDAFFTTAHGSGRSISRKKARKRFDGKELLKKMLEKGIYVKTSSLGGLAEEAGGAYKNIDEVVRATDLAGLSKPVAKLIPIGNIKG